MNRIALPGCNPEPLASYLKALAVLRLVAEQRDSEAKGSWEGEVFYLESVLDEEALVWFFLEDYAPTPVVAPWNHGSGFYEGDDTSGLDAISGRDARRFATYREAIKEIRTWSELPAQQRPLGEMLDAVMRAAASSDGKRKDKLQTLVWAVQRELDNAQRLVPGAASLPLAQIKASGAAKQLAALRRSAAKLRTEFKRLNQDKEAILFACRSRLGESALQWVDAAVSIGADNRPKYPQLLASGGNEGRLDYTNAFMRRLAEVLIAANPYRESLLRAALFGQPSAGLSVEATGQFDPGRAGGFNQGPGIENKDFPTQPMGFHPSHRR